MKKLFLSTILMFASIFVFSQSQSTFTLYANSLREYKAHKIESSDEVNLTCQVNYSNNTLTIIGATKPDMVMKLQHIESESRYSKTEYGFYIKIYKIVATNEKATIFDNAVVALAHMKDSNKLINITIGPHINALAEGYYIMMSRITLSSPIY